jgi:ATP-binding cassette subfamily B protein
MLRPHLRPELPVLAATLLLGLLIAALSAAQPLLTRMLIDEGLIGRQYERIVYACAGMLALALVGTLLGGWHRAIYVRASGRVLFSLRVAVYSHLQRVSPRRLAVIPTGDLVTRLDGDVAEVQRFGTDSAAVFIGSVLSLLVVAAVMLRLSWRLSLVVFGLMPLQLLVRHLARRRIEQSTRQLREAAGGVSAFLIETLAGARAVQGAAAADLEAGRLGRLGDSYLARVVRSQLVGYSTGAGASLLGSASTAAVFLLGGWYVLAGALSVGTLVAYVAYLGRSAGSASSIVGLYTGYQRAMVSLVRVGELLALPVVPSSPHGAPIPESARGDLVLRNVTVRLEREQRDILQGVDLTIPAGTKVVIGGASGAGKSTLADVLRRFVDPDAGTVTFDGQPLDSYRLDDVRRSIAVVEHSPVLFRGSILENLRYGFPDRDEATVREVARDAGIDEFIQSLPDGYGTLVGEGGAGLSTGQRQRIALARALIAKPLVVILDEATSGLDGPTAQSIQHAVDVSFANRTRIVITHRAADVERADMRLELDDGRLTRVEMG